MKRDMDVVREILLQIESKPDAQLPAELKIEGASDAEISYNVMLLSQAGYIHAIDASSGEGHHWMALSLTWQGHEFLDAARNNTVWQSVKTKIKAAGGSFAIHTVKALLLVEGKRYLGLP